jgi:hypothetical protein
VPSSRLARATTPGGCVSHADSPRSRKSGGAIHWPPESKTLRRRPASTSVNAFSLRRRTTGVLSRVTDVASSQLLVDARAEGYERRPISRHERPHPPGVVARAISETRLVQHLEAGGCQENPKSQIPTPKTKPPNTENNRTSTQVRPTAFSTGDVDRGAQHCETLPLSARIIHTNWQRDYKF